MDFAQVVGHCNSAERGADEQSMAGVLAVGTAASQEGIDSCAVDVPGVGIDCRILAEIEREMALQCGHYSNHS